MNSKKNSFKRVAAGALAVLTVAAYTTPVANVGGLPAASILTAKADDGALITVDTEGVVKEQNLVDIGDWQVSLHPDGAVPYAAALKSVDGNTINITAIGSYLRPTGEKDYETGRPEGYAWIGLAFQVPNTVTKVDGKDVPNNRQVYRFLGLNDEIVSNAILNNDGIVTYTRKISYVENEESKEKEFTINISVADTTLYGIAYDADSVPAGENQYDNTVVVETKNNIITTWYDQDVTERAKSERVDFNWGNTVYDWDKGSTYIKSFKVDGTAQTTLNANTTQKVIAGSLIELTSSVPLDFVFNGIGSTVDENGIRSTAIGKLSIAASEKYSAYKFNNDADKPLFTCDGKTSLTPDDMAEALDEEWKEGFDVREEEGRQEPMEE